MPLAHRRSSRPGSGQALTPQTSRGHRIPALLAGGGVLCFFAFSAAACGSQPPPEAQRTSAATVTIGVAESTASGPGVGISNFIGQLSLEGLFRFSEDGRTAPWLAAGWDWEDGFSKLRIHLRPQVFLHDGRSLNGEVAADLLRHAVGLEENKALFPTLANIVSITADGALDVVVELTRPSVFLPEDLTMSLAGGENGTIGTGPYQVVTQSDTELVLERFDRYYLGTPTIAKVHVKPFETVRTAWTSLLRRDVDVVYDVPAEAVEFIRNDDVQVLSYNRRYQYMLVFNSRRGAFRSPAVRRALNLAVDRQDVIDRVLQGAGTPSTGPLWPTYWAYDAAVMPYEFAPEQAAASLDDAGFRMPARGTASGPPARLSFVCIIPQNYAQLERIALELQKNLLDVGVDMRIEAVPPREFGRRIVGGDFDAILNDMSSGATPARAYVFWRSRRSFQGPLNVFGYENTEAERLFNVLAATTNEAAVRSATSRLQQVLLNDPPALFLAWNTRARAIRSEFRVPAGGGDPLSTLWKWTLVGGDGIASAR